MERHDTYGCPTTSPTAALQGINDFAEGLLAYHPRSANVLATADQHADSALANIQAGMLWMFLERPDAVEKSLPYADRAAGVNGLNQREQGLLALLRAWQRYDYQSVFSVGKDLYAQYPQDVTLLKILQYHAFNTGNADLMLQLALQGLTANPRFAPVHSMVAFGYEQMHQIDAAERAAMDALQLDENEPWAHHALAHVHLSRGTTRRGLEILTACASSWSGLNSFMFTHNWWHVALFEIVNGSVDAALKIYDERCWGVQPEYSQDQIGAVSLLARLELAGVDTGHRWQSLLPFLETRVGDVIQPFLSLQYLYGLAKAKSPLVPDMLTLIELQADDPLVVQDQPIWQEVGITVAQALVAHAQGRFDAAASGLAAVRSSLWRIGGSHAQRDLFEQILLDARLRAGHWQAARKMLEQRRQWEPDSPLLQQQLERVYDRLNAR